MRFNTHDKTPRSQNSKRLKVTFAVSLAVVGGAFLFFAVVCSYYAKSILPAVMILLALGVPMGLACIMTCDMNRAYVEIDGEQIRVVDYYFGVKREKTFLTADVASAQSFWGGSFRIKGYRWNLVGMRYIVFRGENGRYLFKILDTQETREAFGAFAEITEA